MIIAKVPCRLSFIGGGTDYENWFKDHSGAVISTAINKFVWITFNNGKVTSNYDVPVKSGLGTSSAHTVGLMKILAEMNSNKVCDPKTIAQFATIIEMDKLAGNIGYQDQLMCSLGGFRLLRFSEAGIRDYEFKDIGWLNPYLMLFHTHQYRKRAGDVVEAQLDEMKQHTELYLKLMDLVEQGKTALESKDWETFGHLIDESWQIKRQLSKKITTDAIDDIHDRAKKSGAIAFKILGSGGGGAGLCVASPDKQDAIKKELSECEFIDFKFSKEGSKVVFRDDIDLR